jgi:hypothetical protein
LLVEINRRVEAYQNILKYFAIFKNLNLRKTSPREYDNCIINLINTYSDDIDAYAFKEELEHFVHFAKNENLNSPSLMYEAIQGVVVSPFPNVDIILKIILSIPVPNISAE